MGKKVTFNDVKNDDGEQDRRMETESVQEEQQHEEHHHAEKEAIKNEVDPLAKTAVPESHFPGHTHDVSALNHIQDLADFFGSKKDDQVSKEYKINPQHVFLIRDFHARKSAGKVIHFSDGNRELLGLLHKKHIKKA